MIGNDVVDLRLARHQTRWNSVTFQQKVLHPEEIKATQNKRLSFTEFWKIWSIKETAYKAHQRKTNQKPKFNPFHFLVEKLSENESKVIVEDKVYYVITYFNQHLAYSFTIPNGNSSFQNFKIQAKHSTFISTIKRKQLNNQLFKNENGIPFWKIRNQKIPISITHHGRFFAFLL